MKGNLSKKKGFLGKLEERDLESIADIVKTHYGKDLEDIKVDIIKLEYKKENADNRTDKISETTNERRGKYASAEAVYDYGQKIKNEANKYTDSLESKHNKRFNTVETNLGTIQTELTEQLNKIEAKVEKEIQDLESKHDKSIKTVEEDITALEEKKENVANRTDKISETTNERRGKYASAEAVYRYGSEIKNKANEYTDVMFDDVVVQFEEADKVIRSDVANNMSNVYESIRLNKTHTYIFDTYELFIEELENSDKHIVNYGKPGEIVIIKEEIFPTLMIIRDNLSYDYNPDKVYALDSISRQGYFEAGGFRFSPTFEYGIKRFEQLSNKILGGNTPVTHPDCVANDNYYPSMKYLKESLEYFRLETIGNIETALDELHSYAQNLISGGDVS